MIEPSGKTDAPADWRDEAKTLNHALHVALGAEPCETACTHFITDRWSLLGLANVAARNGRYPKGDRG